MRLVIAVAWVRRLHRLAGVDARDEAPEPLRIWILEDDLELLAALCQALEQQGHRVLATSDACPSSASGVVEPAPRLDVDLMLIDQRLPSSSGLEVLRRVREAGYRGAAIVMSAYTDEVVAAATPELDLTGVLAKPFTLETLLDSITGARQARGR